MSLINRCMTHEQFITLIYFLAKLVNILQQLLGEWH